MAIDRSKAGFHRRRRDFMKAVSAAGLSLAGAIPERVVAATAPSGPLADPWDKARAIIDRFARPIAFRDHDYPITDHGAAACKVVPTTAWVSFVREATVDTPAPDAKDCHAAIARAIAACHEAGGGRVVIPSGNWYCAGPIVLLSNVNVHLKAGAQILFSNDPADYAKYGTVPCGKNGNLVVARWEGNDLLNFSPMVYAYGQENIALTGEDWTSILNGQAGVAFAGSTECWWSWKGRAAPSASGDIAAGAAGSYVRHHPARSEVSVNPLNPASLASLAPGLGPAQAKLIQGEGERWRCDSNFLRALAEAGVPIEKRVFGLGHYLRPHMIQLIGCTNVLLEGYQVTNTPFWQHNPVNCRNVHARKIYANSLGPNNDGFDPEACSHVLVEDCTFDTGDDCIAVDSGKGPDIQYGPAQNIVIQNCTMQSGHGAITFGSIMSGGIRNVFVQDLTIENAHWKTDPLNIAIRIKTNMSRGGYVRNLHIRNISIPNGVRTTPAYYSPLPGSPIAAKSVATSAGGVITIDCDYDPVNDNVRTRPPSVSDVHISNVTAGDVATPAGRYSSYQAIVIQGPVSASYNGPDQPPKVLPVSNITITDCNLGTPMNAANPLYLYNVEGLALKNVTIGGTVYDKTLSARA
jgi:polygalacturonase